MTRRTVGGLRLGLALMIGGLLAAAAPQPAKANFTSFVQSIWPDARRAGVSEQTFNQVFSGMTPDPDTVRLMNRQAEFTKPIWEYLDSAVSRSRIDTGQSMVRRYSSALDQIEARYGVSRFVVVAVWGMETSYGGFMGNHNVIRALATLAYQAPRRQDFWRSELITALQIVQAGHISFREMEGSWAGAMGHTQFMPNSWKQYSADYDGDGRHDIWTNIPDALASTANYLRAHGWRTGETWGYEVVLPRGFDYALADETTERRISEWARYGITRVSGRDFPRPNDTATLIVPAGAQGPAFLMLPNFSVIKRYNNSTSYALGVGHLADRIMGFGRFAATWPENERTLRRAEVEELQQLLLRRGFDPNGVDGKIGPGTRGAIRQYQSSIGVAADGFATLSLLESLRRGS
ncbi:MAG: lytic murein transglycosylase [Pseudomonadota bacterium]